jgi:hypothetical protein
MTFHRDCSFRLVTTAGCTAEDYRNFIPIRGKSFAFFYKSTQSGYGALAASYPSGSRGFSPGSLRLEREASRLAHGLNISPLISAYELAGSHQCGQDRTAGLGGRVPRGSCPARQPRRGPKTSLE